MGSTGSTNSYANKIQALARGEVFSDSKTSPLNYDNSKLNEVAFRDWQTDENFVGVQSVNVSDIVTVQPNVQANKLLSFNSPVDTSTVSVLKIGDKYYLGDGNHRIVAAYLKGNEKVKVKVYEET